MQRILVADDDDVIRKIFRELLENAGYQVIEAPDGKTALRLHEQTPADLIITDILMPEMEGVEIIMHFRKATPHVKVIAISGGGQVGPDSYLEIARRLGAHRTFTKPLPLTALLDAVRELLEKGDPEVSR